MRSAAELRVVVARHHATGARVALARRSGMHDDARRRALAWRLTSGWSRLARPWSHRVRRSTCLRSGSPAARWTSSAGIADRPSRPSQCWRRSCISDRHHPRWIGWMLARVVADVSRSATLSSGHLRRLAAMARGAHAAGQTAAAGSGPRHWIRWVLIAATLLPAAVPRRPPAVAPLAADRRGARLRHRGRAR